jgi:hypothetical protein
MYCFYSFYDASGAFNHSKGVFFCVYHPGRLIQLNLTFEHQKRRSSRNETTMQGYECIK